MIALLQSFLHSLPCCYCIPNIDQYDYTNVGTITSNSPSSIPENLLTSHLPICDRLNATSYVVDSSRWQSGPKNNLLIAIYFDCVLALNIPQLQKTMLGNNTAEEEEAITIIIAVAGMNRKIGSDISSKKKSSRLSEIPEAQRTAEDRRHCLQLLLPTCIFPLRSLLRDEPTTATRFSHQSSSTG